jgi:hypothetical protein
MRWVRAKKEENAERPTPNIQRPTQTGSSNRRRRFKSAFWRRCQNQHARRVRYPEFSAEDGAGKPGGQISTFDIRLSDGVLWFSELRTLQLWVLHTGVLDDCRAAVTAEFCLFSVSLISQRGKEIYWPLCLRSHPLSTPCQNQLQTPERCARTKWLRAKPPTREAMPCQGGSEQRTGAKKFADSEDSSARLAKVRAGLA